MAFLKNKLFKRSQTDIEKEYDDAYMLLNNEEAQNKKLPAAIADRVLQGEDCEVITGGTGDFGRTESNPIPCNGPLGEWIYLSRLRLRSTGDCLYFHRLKRLASGIDLFELVSTSGQFTDYLYLDMYHPHKSHCSPKGYIQQVELIHPRGILDYSPEFPKGLYPLIVKESKKLLGVKAGDKNAKNINLELAGENRKRVI